MLTLNEIDIWFEDLNEEKQQEVLEAAGISHPSELNWDVFPIGSIWFEDREEESDED